MHTERYHRGPTKTGTCLITPATEVGSADGPADIDCVPSTNITRGVVVADGVLVQGRTGNTADDHSVATVKGNASDAGSALPENLRKVTNIVENIIGNAGLAEPR